jgi:outer membrane lipoprotein carrier protein
LLTNPRLVAILREMSAKWRGWRLSRSVAGAVLLLCGPVWPGVNIPSLSADDSQIPLVKAMEQKYGKANGLQAVFLERYFDNGTLVRAESGRAYFRKPGKMRWEYEKPEKNLFLVDGKYAWFYTPVDRTATKMPARQSEDLRTPLALLTEGGRLSRVCEKVVPATMPAIPAGQVRSANGTGYECILKGEGAKGSSGADRGSSTRIFFEITEKGELARVVAKDAGSVETEFSFKEWAFNPPMAEALFHFNLPPGVVIVDGLLPSSPGARQK